MKRIDEIKKTYKKREKRKATSNMNFSVNVKAMLPSYYADRNS